MKEPVLYPASLKMEAKKVVTEPFPFVPAICIDLKSFYASVECVERGLDPFTTDLVVADPSRGNGAICLAVSPSLKQKGVKNRCRIFEIPNSTLDF